MFRWLLFSVVAVLLAGLAIAGALAPSSSLNVSMASPTLLASGDARATLAIEASGWRGLSPGEMQIEIREGNRRVEVESLRADGRSRVVATLRSSVLPGPVEVEVRAESFEPVRVRFSTLLDPADRFGDGTPDFLRLTAESDREAFRRWFTFLAEAQWLRRGHLPAEINDCAALIRYAYREALREHTGGRASVPQLPFPPPGPGVAKYEYPFTPLGASLFRVRPGPFTPGDLSGDAFAQFADAQTLRRLNTYFIGTDLRRALPGDLLFYRQLEQDLPFHVMIFLGPGHLEPRAAASGNIRDAWLIYHTGPHGGGKGELRHLRVADLLAHPQPRWHPLAGNPNFLGVSRWNILRDGE